MRQPSCFKSAVPRSIVTYKQWREHGDLTHRTSPGRPRLLDATQEEHVKQQLAQANDLKLKVRCARLQETSGALVSEATMCRTLKRLGISRKKDALSE